jgi:hypothetical protein
MTSTARRSVQSQTSVPFGVRPDAPANPPHWRPSWPWWGVASWVLTLGAVALSAFLGGTVPAPGTHAAVASAWFEDHRSSAAAAALMSLAAVPPLLLFISSLSGAVARRGVPSALPRLVVAAGTCASLLAAVGAALIGLLGRTDIDAEPLTAQVLSGAAFALGGPVFAELIGLTCLGVAAALSHVPTAPRGLVVGGFAVGTAALLAVGGLVWPALLPLMPVGRFGGLGWLCAAALFLARPTRPASSPAKGIR